MSVLESLSLAALFAVTAISEPEVTVSGCSSPDAFARALADLVGADVLAASTATVRVDATPSPDGWTTTLDISGDRPMRRTLVAESCEAGMEAAVVVAAMALDPEMLMSGASEEEWMRERPRPPPEPPRARPPKPEAESPSPDPGPAPEPEPEPQQQTALRWEMALGAGGSLGTLPRTSGSVRGVVSARWDWLLVGAGASYTWPHSVEVNTSASARVQLWVATAGLCYVAAFAERWDAPLCLAGQLGRMHGTGRGDGVRSRQGSAVWGAAGVGASVRWWGAQHIGLYAGLEGLGVFARPDLVIEGEGQACCSSPVVLSGSVGPAFRL